MKLLEIVKSLKVGDVGQLLAAPSAEMSVQAKARAFFLLNWLGGKIEKRREGLRIDLLKDIQKVGVLNEDGDFTASFDDDLSLIRQTRTAKTPDSDAIRELLLAKGIEVHEAFDEVKSLVLNPSKLDHLISLGHFKQEEVDALRKVTFALVPKAGAVLTEEMKS